MNLTSVDESLMLVIVCVMLAVVSRHLTQTHRSRYTCTFESLMCYVSGGIPAFDPDTHIISYHITELAMALIHQSSTAPYIHNTVIVIKVARLYVKS